MLHYVHQLAANCVRLLLCWAGTEYFVYLISFAEKNCLLQLKTRLMRVLGVNQNSMVARRK